MELGLRQSAEDYLETILLLADKGGSIRSIDVAKEMNFTKASVSSAMKKLREKNLIVVDKNGYISLTDDGKIAASNVYGRHQTICNWLIGIGVSEKTAEKDACKMEHIISEETFLAIKSCSIKNPNK